MIIGSIELNKFIPSKWELKPFDLKLINNLERNHPFQKNMFLIYKYYPNYQTGGDDEDGVDYYGTGLENDVVEDVDYFKILANFYRYGITFEDDEIYPENVLCVHSCCVKDETFHYIIRNTYDLKTRIFNDVKAINLNDCDTGEITLSEIEKWKRKVINEQQNKKNKLRLLNPTIYRSLITFYIFSNFKERPNNQFNYDISYEGIDKNFRKIKNYKYEHIKNYEDKLSKKFSELGKFPFDEFCV